MSSKAAALLLALPALACQASSPGVPLLDELEVKIGSPPALLLAQAQPVPRGNGRRQSRMLQLFAEVGCRDLEKRWRGESELSHAICTLPGRSASTIVVSANFDQSASRQYGDNWVGAAMLPSLYASLDVEPRLHTYAFVAFADDGHGGLGSPTAALHMVERLPSAERQRIVALVALKGLGLDVSAVWEPVADPDLHVDLFSVSQSLALPMRRVDFSSERSRLPSSDVPSILIGVADRQIGEYLDSFRLVAAYLSYLDQTLELRRRLREAEESAGSWRPAAGPQG